MNESNLNPAIAISIAGLKKQYRLGQIGGTTLQAELQSWWAKKRGREDPNLRIGADPRLIGQKFWALDGVDLTVRKGEALGIIGANGAGKSTLLKILSRITAPTEGDIDIYGRVSSMLEVGTGFHGEMTGRENIYLNGAILGMTRKEIDARMEDIIDFSEVRDFIDTPVKRYSSGMFVKLAFAVAAHLNSEIMVMDEVLAVGDMAFQKKCLSKMREAANVQGRTVLYVSHNMNTIRELCTRCIVLDKGRIVFDGDVEQAIALYMDLAIGEDEVDMDLSQKPHATPDMDFGITMTHLTLRDKVLPIYDNQEPLKMDLTVKISKPVKNVLFRLTLRTDTDQALATSWSEPRNFFRLGEEKVSYSLPLSTLAKGTLYCSIGLFYRNDLGAMVGIDHITRAFKIEIQPRLGAAFWHTGAYGYLKLPDMACLTHTGIYKIADTVVEIRSFYEQVHMLCRDYVWEGTPELTLEITEEDLALEQEKAKETAKQEGRQASASPAYLETLAVYRKLARALVAKNILLFHGSAIAVDDCAYLFTARSGTGKSTHTRLWRERFGERAYMVNDDKPLLKITEEGVLVYGTPWDGKHRLSRNTSVPLKAICVLHRGEENEIHPISASEALPELLQACYRPEDPADMLLFLGLLDRLMKKSGLYSLHCNMDPEAARVSYEGMKGGREC